MSPALATLTALLLSQADAGVRRPTWSPEAFVSAAREVLGVPYVFGGRLRTPGDGIDCQGVLFYAAERVGRCGWKSFSVYPTRSVQRGELGRRVGGLDPVGAAALDLEKLQTGDVLLFVDFAVNPAESSIGALDGRPVWVWHTGVYSGEGRFIVGDHFAGEVVETPLLPYLQEHYPGVLVTRMTSGPHPGRCRTHPPLRRSAPE